MSAVVQKQLAENPSYRAECDLVVLAGDFNQNGAPMHRYQKEFYEQVKAIPDYKPILQLFSNEYLSMLNALRHKPSDAEGWTLIDCLRHSQG